MNVIAVLPVHLPVHVWPAYADAHEALASCAPVPSAHEGLAAHCAVESWHVKHALMLDVSALHVPSHKQNASGFSPPFTHVMKQAPPATTELQLVEYATIWFEYEPDPAHAATPPLHVTDWHDAGIDTLELPWKQAVIPEELDAYVHEPAVHVYVPMM